MRQLVTQYSADVGKDFDYVQGAGGNISWKEDNTLWVKASGTWLADAADQDIFVPVDLAFINECIEKKQFDEKFVSKDPTSGLKPSIETILHAVMPHRVVSHTHLIDAIYYLVQPNYRELLTDLLGDEIRWGVVKYAMPGPKLGKEAAELLEAGNYDVVFLANHGVIVGGDTVEEVEAIYENVRQSLKANLPKMEFATLNHATTNKSINDYQVNPDEEYQGLALDKAVVKRLRDRWAVYPDHVVFLGAVPPIFESESELQHALASDDVNSDYAIVPGQGVFVKASISMSKIAMLNFYYRVLKYTEDLPNVAVLNEAEICELLNWDSEKYRQQIEK